QARQRLTNLQANLGALHHRRGDFAAARSAMLGALDQAQADLGPQHPYIGTLHNNLARASFNLGALHAARDHADQALAVDRLVLDANHPNLAQSLMLSGQINLALGDPAQAESALIESQRIVEQALGREHRFFYMLSVELGRLALLQGDGASAVGHFERAIETRQVRPDYRLSVEDLAFRRYRAMALRQIGQLDQAGLQAEQALELAGQIDDPRGEKPMLILLLAQLAGDRGDPIAARRYLSEAEAAAGCSNEAPCPTLDSPQALLFRALVLAGSGEIEAAFNTLDFAIDQPKWFPQMLSLADLETLNDHPLWSAAVTRLNKRIADDQHVLAVNKNSSGLL
ncbi:MAG: tetratricopeptide repeat protein, partial [Wenzhouxiangella sp.]|nr:tetratricopeptide repeat protein [Wenzhouxiangella sp.]